MLGSVHTGAREAGDTDLGYQTFVNGALVSNIVLIEPASSAVAATTTDTTSVAQPSPSAPSSPSESVTWN
jgi:hypothetical protein